MLNTYEECTAELNRIESEMARLKLEEKHILAVIDLLSKGSTREVPLSHEIFEIVKNNPGFTGRQIKGALKEHATTRELTDALTHLRRYTKTIENRGGRGQAARWYIKEPDVS
jgi:hypothetical protein